MHRDTASIIEIGGQNAKYITDFSDRDQSRIQISMNSSCGDGTGAFLEEQAFRLLLALKDFGRYAAKGASIPRIAGRCSVFAKTDITHHLQEGGPLADILLGLAHALVRNYRTSIMASKQNPRILFRHLLEGAGKRNYPVGCGESMASSLFPPTMRTREYHRIS